MDGYSVKIKESNVELSAKQRIALKDTTNAVKLDEACDVENVVISPEKWAVLSIHNEKSENVDYEVYVIEDANGTKYTTGSASFWNAFNDIKEEMAGEAEAWSITVYKSDSKNFKGKKFITCSII